MPYIAKTYRRRLDPLINQLADEMEKVCEEHSLGEKFGEKTVYAGLLNYAVSRLIGKYVLVTLHYWSIALLTGVLENIKQEFYRRVASRYEDKQIRKNSDIPEYDELAQRIHDI